MLSWAFTVAPRRIAELRGLRTSVEEEQTLLGSVAPGEYQALAALDAHLHERITAWTPWQDLPSLLNIHGGASAVAQALAGPGVARDTLVSAHG